ncbi:MAG: enoyl-CoA delta isomerase 1 [Aureispira sp.]|nr:enoyl-CoA delta isomerase 1 [Aureispira sp.]
MEDKTQLGSVDTVIENGVATITFFHPSHNSLPGKLLAKLANEITTVGNKDEVVVIVLKSGGDRTFCAGASFDELLSIKDLDTGKVFFSGFANVINACRTCAKIIIGRVQGKAVGGGVGVAAATDYCFATKYAAVKLSELAIGIGPFVIGPVVERKVGVSAFSQMALDATTWYPASWAEDRGLYADVFDSVEEMDKAIDELAAQLAKSNPEALGLLKKAFWKGTDDWSSLLAERAAMSGRLVLSDFTVNAINKFRQKA